MSVAYGSELSSANTNAAFVSRTQDTSMIGKLDNQNTTDSSSTTTGAIHTAGGLGVEKKAYLNQAYIASHSGDFALISEADKEIAESIVTKTELEYLSGVTAPLQAQIDAKANDSDVVHNTGNESVAGIKTFLNDTNLNGNVIVGGDLTVNGTTTTINTATLDVEDTNITVNKAGDDTTAQGAGLTVDRTGTKGSLVYDSALASRFKLGDLGSESEVINAASTQTMTGDKTLLTAIVSGNLRFSETVNSTLTGANQTLPSPSPMIHLTNASLTSLGSVDDVYNGKLIYISNQTGSDIVLKHEYLSATAGMRIITENGLDFTFKNSSVVSLLYDSNVQRWRIVSGSGSGAGRAGVSALNTSNDYIDVTFSSPMPSVNYTVSGVFENSVDTDALVWLQFIAKNKTTTGFRAQFNMIPNTTDYKLNWKVDLNV